MGGALVRSTTRCLPSSIKFSSSSFGTVSGSSSSCWDCCAEAAPSACSFSRDSSAGRSGSERSSAVDDVMIRMMSGEEIFCWCFLFGYSQPIHSLSKNAVRFALFKLTMILVYSDPG